MSPYADVSFYMMMGTFVVVLGTLLSMFAIRRTEICFYIIFGVLIVNMIWGYFNMLRPDFLTSMLMSIF